MNYKKEYIRLWNAAEQFLENVDFENRHIESLGALVVLQNAVNFGRSEVTDPTIPCRFCDGAVHMNIDFKCDKCGQ